MQRIPEPKELMDEAEQALAYARADFSEANDLFVSLLLALCGEDFKGHALDIGCGPADIPLRLLRRLPGLNIHALDGAEAMLDLAREAAREAEKRVRRTQFPLVYATLTGYACLAEYAVECHVADDQPSALQAATRAL